mmetsp:Transcript_15034/g.32838  ORF Transcript_15034/g.32838 Transcript_15034/m.32838 type:complete len:80 (+) Transcript_15034:528-767(+)
MWKESPRMPLPQKSYTGATKDKRTVGSPARSVVVEVALVVVTDVVVTRGRVVVTVRVIVVVESKTLTSSVNLYWKMPSQ